MLVVAEVSCTTFMGFRKVVEITDNSTLESIAYDVSGVGESQCERGSYGQRARSFIRADTEPTKDIGLDSPVSPCP